MKSCVARSMTRSRRKLMLFLISVVCATLAVQKLIERCMDGTIDRLLSRPYEEYDYPLTIDAEQLLRSVKEKRWIDVQPINEVSFRFLRKPICPKELKLLVVVKSAPRNLRHRVILRRTWGNYERYKPDVKVIYHVGVTNNRTVADLIDQESSEYEDILQSDYIDSYYNNTFKAIMGLKFAAIYCKQAKFFLNVDDDYYLSMTNTLSFLDDRIRQNHSRLWTGYISHHTPTDRGYGPYAEKSALSLSEYPYDYLPPFIHGGAYVMSIDVLEDFYIVSKYTKFLKLDDVFFGAIAKRLKISPYENRTLFVRPFMRPLGIDDPRLRHVIASHRIGKAEEVEAIWRKLNSH